MLRDKQAPRELKVTDKRIFTAEGEIREEFRDEVHPAAAPAPAPAQPQTQPEAATAQPQREERRSKTMADKAANPGTPFSNFIESLVMQSYMFLGMLRDPRQPKPMFDAAAARETIEIIALLKEKTAGNLSPEESDFLETHLGEVKLAYVQRTKSI